MINIVKTSLLGVLILFLCIFTACQKKESEAEPAKTSDQPPMSSAQQNPQTSWTKDLSGKIAFQSNRDGDWEIYIMNIDGSNLVQLTHNTVTDAYPVWSPDGQQIAFETERDGNSEIYLMNADGTEPQNLSRHPANERDPAWSPDGTRIAFDSDRKSNQELYIMNSDGSDVTTLTETIGRNILPAWAPDEKRMAYTGNRYLGWNVYVMKIDQTHDKRITDGHGACRPDWSPDGKKIAYVSQKADGKGDVWIMNPDGSQKQQLTFDTENYDYYPDWSPDGNHLLYAKTSDKKRGNWELYVMTADGKQHARLTHHPARDEFPNWHSGRVPDELFQGQQFVYEAESSPHQIGAAKGEPDASQGRSLFADQTANPGFLVYGPYASYQPADYVVSFRLKTDREKLQEAVAFIDVATDSGATILAKKELMGTDFLKNQVYQDFQIPFTLQETKILEFRVFSFGKAAIGVDNVTIEIVAGE